ncbi:hypothetical protein R3W88_006133 [Solanum pinnatisectum]|uniref:Uncharacterized protein n=1 Tax=Solanum pinnatisectum TaxID=50273 RepID=A0AAV9KGS6_9SOLN|nr:hypothetical protein R3W88_006133 [Solanum pinnatisectum]
MGGYSSISATSVWTINVMNVLIKLFDDTVKAMSRPLASRLIKGAASYPKFRQATIKMGQKFHDNPVDEKLAMETTVQYLVQSTILGTAWITVFFQMDRYFDHQRQRVLVADQAREQSRKKRKETWKEYDRLREEIQECELRLMLRENYIWRRGN